METKKIKPIYFQCGCTLLDKVIGGNKGVFGVPAGKFINIVGDKSAGKTFLSNEFIAWAHYHFGDKFKWVYDDCESGYSFDTESMYGFEIMPQDESKREFIQKTLKNVFVIFQNLHMNLVKMNGEFM